MMKNNPGDPDKLHTDPRDKLLNNDHPDSVTLARGAGINLVGQLFMVASVFAVNIGLARLLGAYQFGLFHIGWTILRILRLVSSLGLERGMVRYGSKYYPDDPDGLGRVLWKTWSMAFISALFFGGLLFFLAPVISNMVFHKPELIVILRLLAVLLIIVTGLRISASTTRITRKMQYHVLTRMIIQPGVNALFVFLLLGFFGMQLTGALIAVAVSYTLAMLVSMIQVKKLFPLSLRIPEKLSFYSGEILLFSLLSSLSGLLLKLQSWLDRLFIGHYMHASDAGMYVAASQIGNLFVIIMVTFNSIFSPMAARMFFNNNMKRLEDLYRVSTKWGLYFTFCLFLIIATAPGKIMSITFGDAYSGATVTMMLLVVAHLLRAFPGAVGMLLVMTGNQSRWFMLTLLTVGVNVAGNILLIPRYGIEGAAVATVFSVIVLFATGLWQVKIVLNMWPFDRRFLKGLFSAMITAIILTVWHFVTPFGTMASLVISAMITLISFWGILWRFGFDDEDREFAWFIKGWLRRRMAV